MCRPSCTRPLCLAPMPFPRGSHYRCNYCNRQCPRGDYLALILGFLAVLLGTLNVVGGFVVTNRMLEMFKKKEVVAGRCDGLKGLKV